MTRWLYYHHVFDQGGFWNAMLAWKEALLTPRTEVTGKFKQGKCCYEVIFIAVPTAKQRESLKYSPCVTTHTFPLYRNSHEENAEKQV